jgi:hypothetical protein
MRVGAASPGGDGGFAKDLSVWIGGCCKKCPIKTPFAAPVMHRSRPLLGDYVSYVEEAKGRDFA